MSDATFFGPSSKKTYAALNPTDLESLGKIASNKFLNGEMTLNDAVVKLAREYPSISSHQVRRVVEFANQETFARVFEKQAGDKNVDFPLADPGHVLQALNDSARPGSINAIPAEYAEAPVKQAHAAVEADLEIARMFGVDLTSPSIEKMADEARDPIREMYETSALPNHGGVLSSEPAPGGRQMSSDEEAMKVSGPMEDRFSVMGAQQPQAQQAVPQGQMATGPVEQQDPQQAQQDPNAQQGQDPNAQQVAQDPNTQDPNAQSGQDPNAQAGQAPEAAMASDAGGENHQQRMLGLQREIEYAKKREELAKIQQKMIAAMNPQAQAQPGAGQAQQDPNAAQDPNAQAAMQQAQAQQGQQQEQPMEIPQPLSGALATPPGSMPKTSSALLVKQAMNYVKSGRPHAATVRNDLEKAASLDSIKQKLAQRSGYQEANPFGELLRLREKVAHLRDEAVVASETNQSMTKEALDGFVHEVTQHVLREGSLGEVAHALECTPGENHLKYVAIKTAMADLTRRGLDVGKARAEMIAYEMQKHGQVRVANKDNPIVSTFLTFQKIAESQDTFNQAVQELSGYHAQIEQAFREAARHHVATR